MNPIHPTIVWLTWRQTFANRRIYLAVLFSLAPLAVAYLFRSFSPDIVKESRAFYLVLEREIVVGTLLPLAALVFGTTAFGGELDDGTLLYLLVKPVARWRVVFSKYVVAATSTFVLMIPAIFLPWIAVGGADLPVGVPIAFLWGAALGSALYAGVFTMLGLVQKHALVIGLMYVVIIEETLARTVAGIRSVSIREFANAFTIHMADPALTLGTALLSMETVRNVGLVFLIGSLALTVRKLARFQMAERL